MTMFRLRRKEVLKEHIKTRFNNVESLMDKMQHETDKLMDLRQDLKEWK